MNAERLKTLYSYMAGIPRDKVWMRAWRKQADAKHLPRYTLDDATLIHSCNTMACTLGWAAAIPEFKQGGEYLHFSRKLNEVQLKAEDGTVISRDYTAGQYFFDLEYSEAYDLFCPGFTAAEARMTDKKVALYRIRKLLLKRGAITHKRSRELAKYEREL